ncbi:serine hydrolase [Caulobacter segnis]|uniref:serine hydrolase n=1 Tax=Caulobacter segnis TaxID=88688 RepID=UPI00241087E2|nr:serine hydrolase [Caulobacter segnis]MDG2522686.1 serine hydrolase [Caulobacter segnis]
MSFSRRAVLLAPLVTAACAKSVVMDVSSEGMDLKQLDREVGAAAKRAAPGVLGVAITDLGNADVWLHNGDRPFPLDGAAALLIAAAFLDEAAAGRAHMDEMITVRDVDLSPPPSAVSANWPRRDRYAARTLLPMALDGDRTACDLLMKRIGGPGVVTAWIQQKRLKDIRVDRYFRELEVERVGLPSFRADWRTEQAFSNAVGKLSQRRRNAAAEAYLRDPRDTATPRAAMDFLVALHNAELISRTATDQLLDLMRRNGHGANLLRAGLRRDADLAHVSGIGRRDLGRTAAVNDIGLYRQAGGPGLAVAVFLSGSPEPEEAQAALIADVGRAALASRG